MNFSLFSLTLRRLESIQQTVKQSLRQLTKPDNHSLALNTALDMTRSKSELVLENTLLRQQLSVLRRQVQHLKLSWRDRTLIVFLTSKLRLWKQALVIVQPDAVLRWHRDLLRRIWTRKTRHKQTAGRPPLPKKIAALIKQMAKENRTWLDSIKTIIPNQSRVDTCIGWPSPLVHSHRLTTKRQQRVVAGVVELTC